MVEHIDTPSGPQGRRARWHETLSQFDLVVRYLPGPENVLSDAMSRFAYPASSSREDVSFNGRRQAKAELGDIIRNELAEESLVQIVRIERDGSKVLCIGDVLHVGRSKDGRPGDASLHHVEVGSDMMLAVVIDEAGNEVVNPELGFTLDEVGNLIHPLNGDLEVDEAGNEVPAPLDVHGRGGAAEGSPPELESGWDQAPLKNMSLS